MAPKEKFFYRQIDKQPSTGTKIYSDICSRTVSVPRSEQFSESVAQAGKTVSVFRPIAREGKYLMDYNTG